MAMLGGAIAALALGPAGAASASLGSVPAEVSAYVSDGGLVSRLLDIYGKNKDGTAGLPFGDTTTSGPITRVYQWTADRLANKATDHPVQLTNNWVVPISIGSKPVGLATIWINPQTVVPELADFDPSVSTAVALGAVPADAALVRDSATHAWLALAAGTVTPLVAGSSGLSAPVPVASLKLSATSSAAVTSGDPNTGLGLAIGLVALVVVIVAVALLWPRRRATKAVDAAAPKTAPTVAQVLESAAIGAALVEPPNASLDVVEETTTREAGPAPVPARTPRASASKPSSPVTKPPSSKPAGSKPAGRTATSAATSAKPRVQKPPAQKPATPKPATPKQASPKPATAKPATAKPTAKPAGPKPPAAGPAKPPAAPKPRTSRPRTPEPPNDPASDPNAES